MTHLAIHEWGTVPVHDGRGAAPEGSFSRAQADALLAAARAHPLGGAEGRGILGDRRCALKAKGMVGVIAAEGCSLEILPKLDPDAADNPADAPALRERLIGLLDVAWTLRLSTGATAAIAHQPHSVLDVLIRLFAERLITQTRRGLPRAYLTHEEDLPALRGRLDVMRQFTRNIVRPDRLACRFDALSHDIPLLQIMKSCVLLLRRHARAGETLRLLDELRFVMAEVSDIPTSRLPWDRVQINRTQHGWQDLLDMARRFLGRDWQATHHDTRAASGVTLLFPMNDLFEQYVAAMMRRVIDGTKLLLSAQGGLKYCLTDSERQRFQTKPDLLVKQGEKPKAIIDTKWKIVGKDPEDPKRGISQADVYQMMAYGQLYDCDDLILLYPHHKGLGKAGVQQTFTINPTSHRCLRICSVDITSGDAAVLDQLYTLGTGWDHPAENVSHAGAHTLTVSSTK